MTKVELRICRLFRIAVGPLAQRFWDSDLASLDFAISTLGLNIRFSKWEKSLKSTKVRSINQNELEAFKYKNIVSGFKMTLMPKSLLLGIKGFISTPFCVNFSDNILHSFNLINNDLWLFQPDEKLIRSPNVHDPFKSSYII